MTCTRTIEPNNHWAVASAAIGALLVGLLTLNTSSALPTTAGTDALTPMHVAQLRSAAEVAVSPDGSRVAWVRQMPRDPKAEGDGTPWHELRVVDRSKRDQAFVHGEVAVHAVQWAADGKAIAFLAKRGKDKEPALWMIAADGGEAYRALSHKGGIRGYELHPDGETVLFVGRDEPSKQEKKRDKHGFNQRVVEEQDRPWQLFSHHLTKQGEPGWADETPAKPKRAKPFAFALPGSASDIAISPDGKLVAVAIAPTTLIDDHYMERRLHIVALPSGKVVGKLARKGKLGHFAWSPDSKHLAVIGAEDEHDPRAGRLWLVDTAGKLVRDLLPKYDEHVFAAVWRDASTLVYLGATGERTDLDVVTIAGKRSKLQWTGGILRNLTISKNGAVIGARVDSPTHPPEVFAIDAGTGKHERLTDSNPWLAKIRLAKQEAVRFKARDGLEIGGVLVWPRDYKKGTQYPLILSVHGGPEAHVSDGWVSYYSYPGQVAAARGFAVFHPNYRGSTGRGVAFSKLGQNDYAGGEFNDLVDAAQHFIKAGIADAKKVGVTGGSYGGYASAWAATALTKHFAASVMFVGISDQISKFGTTDIPNEMFLVHSRRWPWKHWDYMRERSPVFHVEKARTPILILHGDSDTRVHTSQSMELFRYLKTIGKVPVRLVLYKGEGHGNRRASTRYDYNLRMLRWFEHYLKGKGGAKPPERLDYGLSPAK